MSYRSHMYAAGWFELAGIALIGVGVNGLFGLDWAILSVGLALYVETVR